MLKATMPMPKRKAIEVKVKALRSGFMGACPARDQPTNASLAAQFPTPQCGYRMRGRWICRRPRRAALVEITATMVPPPPDGIAADDCASLQPTTISIIVPVGEI